MTIATTGSKIEYTANGSTTAFNFPYHLSRKTDMTVYLDNVLTAAYTISGTEPFPSGVNIDMNTAPANGVVVLLIRDTDATQPFNLNNNGNFDQESIEDALDNITLVAQDSKGSNDLSEDLAAASATAAAASAASAATSASNASTSASNASTSEGNASTSASNASTSESNASTSASSAATSATNAGVSAAEASAIANGSLNTFTLLPSGTWSPTLAGEAKQITGTSTINLPAPVANFWIKYHVVGDQTVTVNRNGSEDIITALQTFSDDVRTNETGFYTISCLDGVDYLITRSNTTDIYASAPTGADGANGVDGADGADGVDGADGADGADGGGLTDIVNDTTPQLGGELDAGANSIGFTAQTATGDGTTTIDWGSGNKFNFTFGAFNETFTFTAPAKPGNFILKLTQDGTGSRTATWPGTVKWPGGIAPTLTTTASAIDIVSFYFDGTDYYGQAGLAFS